LEDQPRAGRPAELENQRLIELLQEDNRQTIRELAEQLGVDHSTVDVRHLDDLGYKYINLAPGYRMTLSKTINEVVC
jgi:predicted ArsR family transcriptional regulator